MPFFQKIMTLGVSYGRGEGGGGRENGQNGQNGHGWRHDNETLRHDNVQKFMYH